MTEFNITPGTVRHRCVACDWAMRSEETKLIDGAKYAAYKANDGFAIEGLENFEILYKRAEQKPLYLSAGRKTIPVDTRVMTRNAQRQLWKEKLHNSWYTSVTNEHEYLKSIFQTMFQCEIKHYSEASSTDSFKVYFANVGDDETPHWETLEDALKKKEVACFVGFISSVTVDLDERDEEEFMQHILQVPDGYIYIMTLQHQCVMEHSLWCLGNDGYVKMCVSDTHFRKYCFDPIVKKDFVDALQERLGSNDQTIEASIQPDPDNSAVTVIGALDSSSNVLDTYSNEVMIKHIAADEIKNRVAVYRLFVQRFNHFSLLLSVDKKRINQSQQLKKILRDIIDSDTTTKNGFLKGPSGYWQSKLNDLEKLFNTLFLSMKANSDGGKLLLLSLYELLTVASKKIASKKMNAVYIMLNALIPMFLQFDEKKITIGNDFFSMVKIAFMDYQGFFQVPSLKVISDSVDQIIGEVLGLLLVFAKLSGVELSYINVCGVSLVALIHCYFPCGDYGLRNFFGTYIEPVLFGGFDVNTFDFASFASYGNGYCYLNMFQPDRWQHVLLMNRYSPVLGQRGAKRISKIANSDWFVDWVEKYPSKKTGHIMRLGAVPVEPCERLMIDVEELFVSLVNAGGSEPLRYGN